MITPRLLTLEGQVSKALPGFAIAKTTMIARPIGRLICGISFDRSHHDEISFSVTAFVMPLCVPAKHFGFTFGVPVRDGGLGDRWSIDMPDLETKLVAALKTQAMPFLSTGETLDGFVEIAKSIPETGRTLEGLGYALARSGDSKHAVEIFDRLIPMLDPGIAWQRDLANQVRAIGVKLVRDPDGAQEELSQFEDETARNLGVEKLRR